MKILCILRSSIFLLALIAAHQFAAAQEDLAAPQGPKLYKWSEQQVGTWDPSTNFFSKVFSTTTRRRRSGRGS
jgi:hypothetical protein